MKLRHLLVSVTIPALALTACGDDDFSPESAATDRSTATTTSTPAGPIPKAVGEEGGILCDEAFTECEMEFTLDELDAATSCEELGFATYDDSDAGHQLVTIKTRITLAPGASEDAAHFNAFANWNALRPDGVTQPLDPAYSCDGEDLMNIDRWIEPVGRGTTVERLDLYRLPEGATKIALIEPHAQAHWEWDAPSP